MRTVVIPLAAVVLAVGCGSAGATPSNSASTTEAERQRPILRLVSLDPLTVAGARFVAREKVTLLVSAGTAVKRAVKADPRGRFSVRLSVEAGRCTSVVVQAIGSRGSRAMVDMAAPHCYDR